MFYLTKTPGWVQLLYRGSTWVIKTTEKVLFLTFDDGPHPSITPFVLDELKKYNAKATFFCIGKNVEANPALYQRIVDDGHATGNHTQNHLNGWKTSDSQYLNDIEEASHHIHSNLFRPPYGKITSFQLKQLASPRFQLKPVMWTILSGDFDKTVSPEKCLENVVLNSEPGSIIVFHDSEKAYENVKTSLPGTLAYFSEKGYRFEKLVI